MAANVALQNLYSNVTVSSSSVLTFLGVEYEFEWYEEDVAGLGGKVHLRIQTPSDKFTFVSFREIRHTQTRGFYRQYLTFSGGTVTRQITPVKLRGDSAVASQATIEVLEGVTVDEADAFSQVPLWGVSGPGSNKGQGAGLNTTEGVRVIPPGVTVLLEFENASAFDCDWYAYFKQFEILPGAMPETEDV